MPKYIYEIEEGQSDDSEIFIGWIRRHSKQLIQCKDCNHWDGYYCHNKWWGGGYGNYTPPIKKEDGYCDWARRRE